MTTDRVQCEFIIFPGSLFCVNFDYAKELFETVQEYKYCNT